MFWCLSDECTGEVKGSRCLQAGGKVPKDLKKLLLVLMMTLPGSPAVQYNEDIDQTQVTHFALPRLFSVQESVPTGIDFPPEGLRRIVVAWNESDGEKIDCGTLDLPQPLSIQRRSSPLWKFLFPSLQLFI